MTWFLLGYLVAATISLLTIWAASRRGQQTPIAESEEPEATGDPPGLSMKQKALMTALLHDFCTEHPDLVEQALAIRERALDDQIVVGDTDLSGVMRFVAQEKASAATWRREETV